MAEGDGLCAASQPLRVPGPVTASAKDLLELLDGLAAKVNEARAAAETIAEGDPTALAELDAEVEAMAADVAALKAISGGGVGGG